MVSDQRPEGPRRKAAEGVSLIEQAIRDVLCSTGAGLTNNEITKVLGLASDQEGKQKNYLTWSVLGRMMKTGEVRRNRISEGNRRVVRYQLAEIEEA
jgi:uncharacterized protein